MARLTKVLNGEDGGNFQHEAVRPVIRPQVYYPPNISAPHKTTRADIEIHIETVEEEEAISTVPIVEQEDFEIEPLLEMPKEAGLLTLYEPESMVVENEVVVRRPISGVRSPSNISQQLSSSGQEDSIYENKDSHQIGRAHV